MFAITLLRRNLVQLENVLGMKEIKDDKQLETQVVTTWLDAVVSEYNTGLHKMNAGISLAGLHFGYMFVAGLPMIGLNIQNIQGFYGRMDGKSDAVTKEAQRKHVDKTTENVLNARMKELSDDGRIIISEDGKKIITPFTVVSESDNIDIAVNPKTGVSTVTSTNNKKITMVRDETMSTAGNKETVLRVFIMDEKIASSSDTMPAGKLTVQDEEMLKKMGISLPKGAPSKIFVGFRHKGDLRALSIALHGYLKDPSIQANKQEIVRLTGKHPEIFGNKNIDELSQEQLLSFATILIKYATGHNMVMNHAHKNGGKIPQFSRAEKAELHRVIRAEHKVLGVKNTEIISAMAPAEQEMEGKNILRKSFSQEYNVAGASTLMVSTPKGGKHEIVPLAPNTDMFFYGTEHEVKNKKAQEYILINMPKYQIEAQRKALNKFIQ